MIGKGYLSILFTVTTIVVLSALLLVSAISITQWSTAQVEVKGTFSADLTPREGSNATGKATLELQDNGKSVKYDVSASGLKGNVSGIVISQEMGSGRAPDVVSLKQASQSGLGPESGSASGNFTKSDLIGPLEGKDIADFVKAINDGKIIFRIMTEAAPLGELIGNMAAGGGAGTAMNAAANGAGTAMNATANATGTAMNATANATGTTMTQPESVVSTPANATANATGTAME